MVIGYTIRIICIAAKYRRPLIPVIAHDACVAIHDPCQSRIERQRRHIELRKVDVLRAERYGEQKKRENSYCAENVQEIVVITKI